MENTSNSNSHSHFGSGSNSDSDKKEFLSGRMSGQIETDIYYEDTDLSGFVYHANYLKYFERAREHIIGVTYLRDLYDKGLHFVVSKAELTYLAPLRHADRLLVESEGMFSRSPAIPFIQKAYKKTAGKKELVAEGKITIVALNKSHRPVKMPDEALSYFHTRQHLKGENHV